MTVKLEERPNWYEIALLNEFDSPVSTYVDAGYWMVSASGCLVFYESGSQKRISAFAQGGWLRVNEVQAEEVPEAYR